MNLIVRADADAKIGTGHLMRSLALAQIWQSNGGAVTFITNCESEGLRERLKIEGFGVVKLENSYPHESDLETTLKVLEDFPNAWCALDGYNFDAQFHRAIRRKGNPLLVIDDMAQLGFYAADAILNQNINAAELKYNCPPETILLLGTRFALLRREFLEQQDFEREPPKVARKILITMGGSDLHNQTLKAIRALERLEIESLEARAVVGASNPHLAELEKFVENSAVHIELVRAAENMCELMLWAEVAVAAAGSTCWELAFMQVPGILMVTAENQTRIAIGLDSAACAINLGWFEQVSAEALSENLAKLIADAPLRREMSRRGRKIIDGRGAQRVFEALCVSV